MNSGSKERGAMSSKVEVSDGKIAEYVTVVIGGQLFGLPISRVRRDTT